jgi:cell volume regulation protein A
MTVSVFLLILGGLIVLGFVGSFFFEKTKIPNPVILMMVGIVLGPASGWIKSDALLVVAPYFGTVALILIMFEGGLELEFELALKQFKTAMLLGLLYFVLAVGAVTLVVNMLLDVPLPVALLYGFILGGTSPAVIFPMLSKMRIGKTLKTLLSLETALTEVLTVVSVVLAFDVLKEPKSASVGEVVGHIVTSVVVSFAIALAAGVVWSRFLGVFSKTPLSYMLTLGFVMILYAIAEMLGGDAAITVLFFGMILGNASWLASKTIPKLQAITNLDVKEAQFEIDEVIKNINAELSFLIRTYFFAFMGLLIDFSTISEPIALAAAALLAAMVFLRWASVKIIMPLSEALRQTHSSASVAMLPRGLACAVMALVAMQTGIAGLEQLLPVVFCIILFTNLIAAALVFYYESRHATSSVADTFSEGTETRSVEASDANPRP